MDTKEFEAKRAAATRLLLCSTAINASINPLIEQLNHFSTMLKYDEKLPFDVLLLREQALIKAEQLLKSIEQLIEAQKAVVLAELGELGKAKLQMLGINREDLHGKQSD